MLQPFFLQRELPSDHDAKQHCFVSPLIGGPAHFADANDFLPGSSHLHHHHRQPHHHPRHHTRCFWAQVVWAQFADSISCVHWLPSSLWSVIRTGAVLKYMDRKTRNVRKNEQSAGGGFKQRQEADVASSSSEPMHSELARFLLISYLSGKTSLPFIVAIASLVLKEPAGGHSDIHHIASLGGNGAAPGDMRKNLWSRMRTFALESAMATLRLPVKIRGQLDWIDFDMLYPHALFAKLYESDKVEFGRRFYGGVRDRIRTFWKGQVDHPSFAGRPMHDNEYNHEEYACPLFFIAAMSAALGLVRCGQKL